MALNLTQHGYLNRAQRGRGTQASGGTLRLCSGVDKAAQQRPACRFVSDGHYSQIFQNLISRQPFFTATFHRDFECIHLGEGPVHAFHTGARSPRIVSH